MAPRLLQLKGRSTVLGLTVPPMPGGARLRSDRIGL